MSTKAGQRPNDRDRPAQHVLETVESIATMHAKALAAVGPHQRGVEAVTARLGRPSSVYFIVLFAAAWVAFNVLTMRGGSAPFDAPPFPVLQCVASVAALVTTLMILTAQNRQTKHADQRAQLDLQVSLLVDAKVTKLIALVEELRRDMPSVPDRVDPTAEAMKANVDPDQVMAALDDTLERNGDAG